MKTLTLIAGLFLTVNMGFSQKHTMINSKDISPLSFGAMPVFFASMDEGGGLGLEINGRHALTKDLGAGVFGRMKSLINETSSSTYNEYSLEPTSNGLETSNIFSVGAVMDYHLFRAITLQLRGGYELEADNDARKMNPRIIYGGAVIVNFSKSQSHKIAHSLRIGVDFETNNRIDVLYPAVNFSDFPYAQNIDEGNANIHRFSLQVGWNFQFHSIKRKR
ncbi:MAG: hypothetical protein ACPGSL_01500 [Vicingaceae bacterium]